MREHLAMNASTIAHIIWFLALGYCVSLFCFKKEK